MMRVAQLAILVLALGHMASAETSMDRPITKVVKLLQGMLEKSKVDGERDWELFAKYKCYCDSNAAEKKASIDSNNEAIQLLAAEIAELQGKTGKLSSDHSDLENGMSDNERARATADSLRSKANEAFVAEETDMLAAAEQMNQAIETLSAVGADQTALLSQKFMTGKGGAPVLLKVGSEVQKALGAASVFLTQKQKTTVTAFLQAPFAGAYSSQSGEIVGIIKNMRDTFKANLATARTSEASDLESYTKLSKVKNDEFDGMKAAADENEAQMGRNDGSLSTKKTQKTDAETTLASDEEFLAKLQKLCATKTTEYEDRKMIRANEDAAIAQATVILNGEGAFDNFGKTESTGFLQLGRSVRRVSVRSEVQRQLASDAKMKKSLKLARVAAALEQGNPFDKVLDEITAMIELIDKEEKADDEQKAWCDSEREENHSLKSDKSSSINTLNGQITTLNDELDSEVDGLRKQMKDEEDSLAQNRKDQATSVSERAEENAAYQGNIANLVEGAKTVKMATAVLSKFYDMLAKKLGPHHYDKKAGKDSGGSNIKRIPEASTADLEEACSADPACTGFNSDGWLKSKIVADDKLYDSSSDLHVKVYESLLQVGSKEDPAPPETGADTAEGQSGQGNEVISQLEFILSETLAEEQQAHTDEEGAQHDFEDEMTTLKSQEQTSMDTVASLEEQIADKEKQLVARNEELAKTKKEKVAIEVYLLKIKPGCDFITENIDTRKSNRDSEKSSLETAMEKLQSTPAFKSAAAEAEKEALGECGKHCIPDKETLACKACLAGTSESGYCAGHSDQAGC